MNLQENISRIREVMGLNEQYPEGIDPKDLEALEVPIDNVEPEEIPNEEEPKDSDDFSNSVVPQIVWRAGRVGVSPKGGGIWFGETKKDVENFAWSVRDERREGLPYYINLQNPRYYKNFWKIFSSKFYKYILDCNIFCSPACGGNLSTFLGGNDTKLPYCLFSWRGWKNRNLQF